MPAQDVLLAQDLTQLTMSSPVLNSLISKQVHAAAEQAAAPGPRSAWAPVPTCAQTSPCSPSRPSSLSPPPIPDIRRPHVPPA